MRILPFVLVVSVLVGCNNGSNPPGGPPPGVALGGTCDSGDKKCRQGLKCDETSKVCVGLADKMDGDQCQIGDERQSGQCGPNGVKGKCVQAGSGVPGTQCSGDAQCGKGLKCAFDGETLFPVCLKGGGKDYLADCTLSRECAQGLLCEKGKCQQLPLNAVNAPNGYPPFIPSATNTWQGAKCPPVSTTTVKALWEIPRAGDPEKEDFFRLPYPNDAARDADGKVDYARFPKDPAPPFGFDALGRYLDAMGKEPFGNYGTVTFRFDGAVKFESISATGANPQTRFVDLTPGPRFGLGRGLYYTINSGRTRYVCHNYLALRGAPGDVMIEGTYAFILLKGPTAEVSGSAVEPSPDFQAMLQASAPAEAALARAWTAYQPLRDYLATQNIPVANVLTAAVFTVGDPQALVKKLAESVAAAAPPVADAWVKCTGPTSVSPCTDAIGVRGCGAVNPNFDEWHTLVDIPVFQKGTAPYLAPSAGGDIAAATSAGADAGTLIQPVRREKVCASLTVPTGTMPAMGWPLVIYGHGTGGSFRGHAGDGSANAASVAQLPNVTGPSPFAMLGFDAVGHGPRRGTRTDMHPDNIVYNFANPLSARGTNAQGGADLHSFARLAKEMAANTPAGLPKLDASNLALWGHSQGATAGALFLATDRTTNAALLTGASASITDALLSKKAPINIAGGMWLALSEQSPASVDQFHPVLSILQNYIDPVDPVHFARNVAVVPADGATPAYARHVFQVWGKDDTYTARPVQSVFAVAARLLFVGPKNDDIEGSPVASAKGNIASPRMVTAAFRQYVPASTYDGHFVVFNEPTAQRDAIRFLARSLRGEVPMIPEP